jgi:hypothetical protein
MEIDMTREEQNRATVLMIEALVSKLGSTRSVGGRQYDYARDMYNVALNTVEPTDADVAHAARWLMLKGG